MKHTIIILLLSAIAFANTADYKIIKNSSDKVQALWMAYTSSQLDPVQLNIVTQDLKTQDLSYSDKLRVTQMKLSFNSSKSIHNAVPSNISMQEAIKIVSDMPSFTKINFAHETVEILKMAQQEIEEVNKNSTTNLKAVTELLRKTPDYANFKNGEYKDALKVFMFCREDRNYPCRVIMKDIFDNFITNDDGSVWSLPTLALSKYALPYNVTNGSTPTGVHTIDSVMPEANRQKAFGKHRRLILDWIETDKSMYHLLPKASLKLKWWKQASIARDNGRKWLRIHGTGNMNTDQSSTYYPHFPTSGCISTKEGKYDVEYKDQRILLDKMMSAMQVAPVFTNEVDLKGILYVINLDNEKQAVTDKDIIKLLK